jgi:hypothetical protein
MYKLFFKVLSKYAKEERRSRVQWIHVRLVESSEEKINILETPKSMYKSRASEFQVSYFVSFCSRSNLGTALST